MRRKAVLLVAAVAESLRFLALAFLAFDVGALLDPSASSLLRYAAAPQLLFAAGFFFMWLDHPRYSEFRPLLLIGKAACLVCFLPLASTLARDPRAAQAVLGVRGLGLALAFFIAAADIFGLTVLALVGRPSPLPAEPGAIEASAPAAVQEPGQGPGDIEKVEG
jgi:hypothetical protein